MNLSNLPSGMAPDGTGDNIYDNGSFGSTEAWTQVYASTYRSDADWTGDYLGNRARRSHARIRV